MRGKLVDSVNANHGDRITPAGAGKTQPVTSDPSVHRGSPPQVRGKLYTNAFLHCWKRITPAGAGKTITAAYAKILHKDHPRRCGENHYTCFATFEGIGSPPQVRGKHSDLQPNMLLAGITPAGAGKTNCVIFANYKAEDHPRRCGENQGRQLLCLSVLGSPPQVRGKLSIPSLSNDDNRITPAGAGKTPLRRHCKRHTRDHPRRCGENFLGFPSLFHAHRITPAGAGKTSGKRDQP